MSSSIARWLEETDPARQTPPATPAAGGLVVPRGGQADDEPAQVTRWLTGEDRTAPLGAAMRASATRNGDEAARVLRLQAKTGLPADLIGRNLDTIEAQARRADFDPETFRKASPIVAAWLAEHPDRAAVAREDLTTLSYLERQLGSIGAQFREGRATTELAEIGEAAILGRATPAQRARQRELEQQVGRAQADYGITGFFEGIPGAIANQLPIFANTLLGKVKSAAAGGAVGAGVGAVSGAVTAAIGGQLGPQVAAPEEVVTVPGAALAGATRGGAAGATLGWRYGAGVAAARMEAGLAYLDFEQITDENGLPLDRETALGAAALVGIVNGGLEMVGFESILGAVPGARALGRTQVKRALMSQTSRQAIQRYAKVVGQAMAGEGATEFLQSLVSSAAGELAAMGQDGRMGTMSTGAILDRVFSEANLTQAAQEARAGAQGGGGIAAVAGGASVAVDLRRARQATATAEAFAGIGTGIADAQLTARLPEGMQDVVQRLTTDGPIEHVYAPIESFNEYWQSQGIADPGLVAEEILGSRDAYEEAVRTGGDLVIPTARYAVTLAPTEHNAFFAEELRASPDAMNGREARALGAELDAMEAAQQAEAAPTEEPAAQVAATVQTQLEAAGFDAQTAGTYAALYGTAFRTLGERAGVDPLALFERFGLTIARDDGAQPAPSAGQPIDRAQLVARAVALRETQAGRAEAAAERDAIAAGDGPYALARDQRDAAARVGSEFTYARTASGTLRANLASVHVDGLVDELAGLYEAQNADARAAVPSVISDEGMHTFNDGRPYVGMKGGAVRASGRMAARTKSITRIETELARRGVEDVDARVWQRLSGAPMDEAALDFAFEQAPMLAEAPAGLIDEALAMPAAPAQRVASWRAPRQAHEGPSVDEIMAAFNAGMAQLRNFPNERRQLLLDAARQQQQGESETLWTRAHPNPQLATEAFREWFGESEVVDADGAPLVMYHATEGGVDVLDPARTTDGRLWFTRDRAAVERGAPAAILPVYLSAERLATEAQAAGRTTEELRAQGFDGIRRGDDVAVFEPAQVKSASANRGGFDPANPSILHQPAFHGSPHIFDQFSTEGIGTGEGAQAYGWGLYFAGKRAIAAFYREKLSRNTQPSLDVLRAYFTPGRIIKSYGGSDDRVLAFDDGVASSTGWTVTVEAVRNRDGAWVSAGERPRVHRTTPSHADIEAVLGKQKLGRLYTVEIPEDDTMLLWDRPLSEQPPAVQAALESIDFPMRDRWQESGAWPHVRGQDLYEALAADLADQTRQDNGWTSIVQTFNDRVVDQESASRALAALGINGIKYLDGTSRGAGEGSYNYVVFDDQLVKILEYEQAQQPADPGPRGRIRIGAGGMNIELFKTADLSTFLHETGHFYLEVLQDLALQPGAREDLVADYAIVRAWLGVEDLAPLTREQHEQFARGFERYLMEGDAPTSELRAAFARFRAWLTYVYRSLTRLQVELTPEVRGVFDRLLATETEIAAAEVEQGALPLFADPAAVGMSEAEAARYRTAVATARRTAEEQLSHQLLERIRREQTAVWKQERAAVRAEVAAEVNTEPVMLARAVLSRGTMPDGTALPEDVPAVKLDRRALVEEYATRPEYADLLARLPRPHVYAREDGIHPDDAAALFGFTSGDALLQALLASESPRARIDALTDARMTERHGDLLTDGGLPAAAMDAVHNEHRARLLRTELQHLASANLPAMKGLVRAVTRRVPTIEAVRAQAERTIAAKKVRDIRPLVHQRAEAKSAQAAVAALLRGDLETAFEEKQRELLNHELWRAATRARETVDGIVAYLNTFARPTMRQRLGKAGPDYLAQIDAIRERYQFTPATSLRALDRRASLLTFVAEQAAAGTPITVPEALVREAQRQHYKDTPLEELVGVRDTVQQIAHLARLKNKLLASARARDLAEARTEIIGALGASFDLTRPPDDLNPALRDRLVTGLRRFAAEHTRMEFFVRWLDGGQATGPIWQYLFKPFADAEAAELERRQADGEALKRIFGAYTAKERAAMHRQRLHLPNLATGQVTGTLTKANLLAMALNWGNAYNRDALLRGYGWSERQVEAVFEQLDARDWATVQAVWDHLESFWPAIAAQEQALTGLVPEKVEALPFTMRGPGGTASTLRGGYYPIKFDGDLSTRQAALDEKASVAEMFGGGWARAMTRHGHTEARTNTGGKPLRLELGVIGEHLAQVGHDLTHRPAVLDVARLIADPEIQAAIEAAAGRDLYRQLNPWLVGIAGDRGAGPGTRFERVLGHLRTGATVVGLGFRVTSALSQTLGFANTLQELGPRATARGVRAVFAGGPRGLARQWRFVAERSVMMRDRRANFDRDVRDYVRTQSFLLPDTSAYFTLIGWLDLAVSVPSWLGAYGAAMDGEVQGVEPGMESAAIDYADMVVRTTQAAGAAKDLAAIQRGSEAMKLFTMYYSSFNVIYNQMQQAGQSFARTKDVPRLVAALTLLWFLPPVLEDLMKGRGPEEDEDWWAWLAQTVGLYPFATLVGVRDVGSAVDWSLTTGQRSFDGSPAFGAGEALTGTLLGLVKAADPDQDVARRDVKDAVLTVGYFAKLPTSQLWTSAEYLHDVLTGRTTPETPLDFGWNAITRGTPRADR